MRAPLVLALAIGVSGCATQAQRESQRISQVASEMKAETDSCVGAINSNQKYAELWTHVPKVGEKATLAQLSDQSFITSQQQIAYLALQSDIAKYRTQHDSKLRTFAPSLVSIEDSREADADAIRVKLLHRQIS